MPNTGEHDELRSRAGEDDEHGGHDHTSRRHRDRRQSPLSMKLRFKSRSSTSHRHDRSSKRHHSRHEHDTHRPSKRHKRHSEANPQRSSPPAAHPFPREPTTPTASGHTNADAAFRDSLFDALADDEGAAYWENVYSEPMHVYARPETQKPEGGELEQMTDDEYAAYVRTKMWERMNPQEMLERERSLRREREAAEKKTRQREEYVRRKQRAAWERAQEAGARKYASVDSEDEGSQKDWDSRGRDHRRASHSPIPSSSLFEDDFPTRRSRRDPAWEAYVTGWEQLNDELTAARTLEPAQSQPKLTAAVHQMQWPVLGSRPIDRANVQTFLERMPSSEGDGDTDQSRLHLLKAERVRWHPDKMQQRFGGVLDAATVQRVTAVFQIIDAIVSELRP